MKLVITDSKISIFDYLEITDGMVSHQIPTAYGDESFNELKKKLMNFRETDNSVYVSAEERPLLLVPEVFEIDDVYIYRNGLVKPIRECTTRQLRGGHDIFKLYLAGEFEF